MANAAKVESLDALKELRTFLCSLAVKISQSLDEADSDIQNTLNWLKQDRYPYWKNQQAKRHEELVKAKLELNRKQCLDDPRIRGEKSYVDEKRVIAMAQKRLEHAESQFKKVHNWIPRLEKQVYDCRTALQGLAILIQHDLPKKRTQIDQMIYSLESYLDLTAPETKTPFAMEPSDSRDDMSKPIEPSKEKPSESISDIYTRLRNRNPFNSMKDELHKGEAEFHLFDLENDPALNAISKHIHKDMDAENEVTVIVDASIHTANFIFVERVVIAKDGKSNLYIMPVETDPSTHYFTYPLSDFLSWNPSWRSVFSLPAGWITLLKDKQTVSIFDADEHVIYELHEDLG